MRRSSMKLSRRKARKIVTEEKNTAKAYNKYGFRKQARQEKQHAKTFRKYYLKNKKR
jgi:hypothetical protein